MDVSADVCGQIGGGEKAIIGVMIESHLVEGSRASKAASRWFTASVTDGCIGWQDTETVLRDLAAAVKARRG